MTHPIYAAVAATTPSARIGLAAPVYYVGLADTARLIRAALAARWPGVRFYVRSSSYSGGSSIDVNYDGLDHYAPLTSCHCIDGPTTRDYDPNRCTVCGYVGRLEAIYKHGAPALADVHDLVAPFAGRGFDGSIDLAYAIEAWLSPDGSTTFAHTSGTAGSMGSVPEAIGSRRHGSALLVRFGASYVFAEATLPYNVARKRDAA